MIEMAIVLGCDWILCTHGVFGATTMGMIIIPPSDDECHKRIDKIGNYR